MPTTVGPNTYGEENLVFGYDLRDTQNSYKGEPTSNAAYLHNGRKDSSYESYMPESATGQIAALHPGAIRVYNQAGSDISYYLNTGINVGNSGVNWYDTNHAYWVYDDILKKPVVQMIDRNGVWQAKYMGLGVNWADLGLTNGDQYTISWLQWSSDGVKRPNVGIYWYDTTAGYSNFWDGTSDTGNSTPGKWTRVSQTFTLSAGKSLDQGLNCYMYGMYYSRAILRIADVQIEKKSHATPFTFSNTRSATQGLLDLTGNSTIDLTNVSFDSNAQMTFDGSNDYISIPNTTSYGNFTAEVVIKPTSNPNNSAAAISTEYPGTNSTVNFAIGFDGSDFMGGFYNGSSGGWHQIRISLPTLNVYTHYALTYNGTQMVFYKNGISAGTLSTTDIAAGGNPIRIGRRWDIAEYFPGDIDVAKVYNRALTASEIRANYNAIKGRFNI